MSDSLPPSVSTNAETSDVAPSLWAGLSALGFLHSLWSLFLWSELLVIRQGGSAFCSLGETFQCTALWDGPFASFVHDVTRLPVAGWGLLWSALATGFPLFLLLRQAERKNTTWEPTALRLLAALGALVVLGLIVVALRSGVVCLGCMVTYLLVSLYAALAWFPLRKRPWLSLPTAFGRTVSAALVVYLLLLYPGQHTPKAQAQAASDALARAATAAPPTTTHGNAGHGAHGHSSHVGAGTAHDLGQGPATGDADSDAKLFDLVRTLPPALQQGLADALWQYNQSAPRPSMTPRVFKGPENAGLRLTEWTDIRCGHCAALMETLKQIESIAPPGSFRVEPRHFPLDGTCNPHVPRKSPDGVSCTAAKAQICLEQHPRLFDFIEAMFAEQQSLTEARIYELAGAYIAKNQLQACMNSQETASRLAADIAYAMEHGLDGTPLVVANGKKGSGFGPFLYALVLTQGAGRHPAFAELPAPNPNAHIH